MTTWCDSCGHDHGDLYVCPSYPPERVAEIEEADREWRKQLNDPNWIEEQVVKYGEEGRVAVAVFRAFAGMDPGRDN